MASVLAKLGTRGRNAARAKTAGASIAQTVAQAVRRAWVTLNDLVIQTKRGKLIRLGENLTKGQKQLLDDMCPKWRQGDLTLRPGWKGVNVKARQLGITTLMLAVTFCNVCNRSDINALFLADLDTNTEAAFQKVSIFYDNLPASKKPPKKYSSKRELVFADNRSTFRILTAGGGRVGQSRTLHIVHGSEVSNWAKAAETAPGLLNSVPDEVGCVLLESTAKGDGVKDEDGNITGGRGAFFAVAYREAKEGKSGYTAHFLPWWKQTEYKRALAPGQFEGDDRPTDDKDAKTQNRERRRMYRRYGNEMREVARFGLTLEQLAWRRWKITQPGQGLSKFRQEYPGDDVEAFKTGGGVFVPEWDEDLHEVEYRSIEALEELYGPVTEYRGGYDYGRSAPFSFHLVAIWRHSNGKLKHIEFLEEEYEGGQTETQQRERIIAALERRGLKPGQVVIYADPSIFGPADKAKRLSVKYIADWFTEVGLRFEPAENDHLTTNTYAKTLLVQPDMIAVQPQCAALRRTAPALLTSAKDPDDFEDGQEDHAWDSGMRYCLSGRRQSKKAPPAALPTVGGTNRSGVPKMKTTTGTTSIFVGGGRRR